MAVTESSAATHRAHTARATCDPLPRGSETPECRTGADRWPDLHELCHAPGHQDRMLGWVRVPCACERHQEAP